MNAAQKSLQGARIIHIALLVASIAYLVVARYVTANPKGELPIAVAGGIGLAAFSMLLVAAFLRSKLVKPGAEALRNNADDTGAATKWRAGTIVSLVFAESVVLFGMVLKMVGFSWNVSGIFYVVGILFLLAWWPKLELTAGRIC